MANDIEKMGPEDDEVTGCCSNPTEPKEKDYRAEADAEMERIKREADKANHDIEQVVEKGSDAQ
jgi:hypothetical protein